MILNKTFIVVLRITIDYPWNKNKTIVENNISIRDEYYIISKKKKQNLQ